MTTDIATCGYLEGAGLSPCGQAPELIEGRRMLRCIQHRLRICAGCAAEAISDCQATNLLGQFCGAHLCMSCEHNSDGSHARDAGGAFANQRPPAPSAPELARAAMIKVLGELLSDLDHRGYLALNRGHEDIVERVAGVLVDGLATHVLVQMMSGIVVGQAQS